MKTVKMTICFCCIVCLLGCAVEKSISSEKKITIAGDEKNKN